MPDTSKLREAIIQGKRQDVVEIVEEAIRDKANLFKLLEECMIPAMREVGQRFSRGELYVPDMLIAARAMQAGLDLVEPILAETARESRGRIAIGTVKGDLHDIGKNLVAMLLKGAGHDVIDLGVDCSIEKFDQAVEEGATVVCLSALLTTTMPYMKQVVEHYKSRESIKVVIGGAPITREYAREIGAHAYGGNANEAVRAVESCLSS